MKKIFFLLPLIFLTSCGIHKTLTVDRLQLDMSRADVENIFGRPEKILIVSMTEHGRQDILTYKIGNDLYMLEFMNDLLIRYEFLREDAVYVQPPPPVRPAPDVRPPAPRPRPSPLPAATVNQGNTQREIQSSERPSRRPDSEKTVQGQTTERGRPTTNRTERRDDSGLSNRNNISSEESANNRRTKD